MTKLDTAYTLQTGAPDHEAWDADRPKPRGTWHVAQCSARTGRVLWLGPALDSREAAHDAADAHRRTEPSPRLTWRAVLR